MKLGGKESSLIRYLFFHKCIQLMIPVTFILMMWTIKKMNTRFNSGQQVSISVPSIAICVILKKMTLVGG